MKIPMKVRQKAKQIAIDFLGHPNPKWRGEITRGAHVLRSDVSSAYLVGWEDGFVAGQRAWGEWTSKTPTEPGVYLQAFVDEEGNQSTRLRWIKAGVLRTEANQSGLTVEPGFCFGIEDLDSFMRMKEQSGMYKNDKIYWMRFEIPIAPGKVTNVE